MRATQMADAVQDQPPFPADFGTQQMSDQMYLQTIRCVEKSRELLARVDRMIRRAPPEQKPH